MERATSIALVFIVFFFLSFVSNPHAQPRRDTSRFQDQKWLVSVSTWRNYFESYRQTDGARFLSYSDQRALEVGRHFNWNRGTLGCTLQAGLFLGKSTSESQDPRFIFLSQENQIYGATLSSGFFRHFESKRLWIGALIEVRLLSSNLQLPRGFEPSVSNPFWRQYLRLDFTFPITPKAELFQQIGISDASSDELIWSLGFRL